ncbi:amino acid ABC transporter ATP-binding protein [Paraphotobacterium marinum]|uniref:Amino acid ABC transporter ATP-binding protein n=1 Tax=Paraphotobacterium marinum TaxID=1755811 RepID=A0A220VCW4_9GAMM|nr:amino acid ABC transporter ATP-binding protein [Paraphotobacterium marinum]ASK78140.1 amino acid ABC transporter ATP-binding protein [Paraphotobacterium marinum]
MIKISNLEKKYNNQIIFNDLNFTIEKGEVISIIGPSGTGKSTLLRCLNLLEIPDKGTLEIDKIKFNASHYKLNEINKIRLKTSFVFQNYGLFRNLNIINNITLGLTKVNGIDKVEANKIASDLLESIGLLDKMYSYPSSLSGGQQQRVAITRALALNRNLMLLDEPTSSLDPQWVKEVLNLIKTISLSDQTMIIVTHEMNFAKSISDRIFFMMDKKIVEQGSPNEIFDNPKSLKLKKFLKNL